MSADDVRHEPHQPWRAPDPEALPEDLAQKRRLAAAVRRVIERMVTSDAPTEELRVAADRLEAYADQLDRHPRRTSIYGWAETSMSGDVSGFFDYSPQIGLSNPLAPPLTLWKDGERVRGRARFGQAYEGPPHHVHGGHIAAAHDELLGFAQSLTGRPGMTGTLTIRYRKPTPLHAELRMEAWVDRVEGRKIFAAGSLFAGDTLCNESEGIFVSMEPGRFTALAGPGASEPDKG